MENQRLIYVGNELTDGTTLRDLIKEKVYHDSHSDCEYYCYCCCC